MKQALETPLLGSVGRSDVPLCERDNQVGGSRLSVSEVDSVHRTMSQLKQEKDLTPQSLFSCKEVRLICSEGL